MRELKEILKFYLSKIISNSKNRKLIKAIIFFFPNRINKKLNYTFIHIPKNAGTTFNRLNGNHKPWGHHKSYQFKNKINQNTFAIFREPVDKFNSAFHYLKETKNKNNFYFNHNLKIISECYSPNDLIKKVIKNEISFNKLFLYEHFQPQYLWLTVNQRFNINYLVNFSRINEGIEKLNIFTNNNFMIDHKLNESKNKTSKNELSSESIRILHKAYEIDLNIFKMIKDREIISNLFEKKIIF